MPKPSAPKTIRLERGFDQWRDVAPEFADHVGDTEPRDHDGAAGLHYTNQSGRNDIIACKVARDSRNVYFYVRSRESITPCSTNWMWLLIDADQNASTGWAGYDFIVNRTMKSDSKSWLEKNDGGWNWKKIAGVELRVQGNELHLVIPRQELGFTKRAARCSFDFKWTDNLQRLGDVMDFYVSGDVAPEGRFNYRFTE